MTTVYDIPADVLIPRVAKELEGLDAIEAPDWATFAKTGVHREAAPSQDDWWYIRAASVLRRIYVDGPIGVQRMRTFYGGKQDRGSNPYRFRKGSGSVSRKILQQLEAAGFVETVKQGRKVSPAGQKFLDNLAHQLKPVVAESVPGIANY